jgi:hypothetical protein
MFAGPDTNLWMAGSEEARESWAKLKEALG